MHRILASQFLITHTKAWCSSGLDCKQTQWLKAKLHPNPAGHSLLPPYSSIDYDGFLQ